MVEDFAASHFESCRSVVLAIFTDYKLVNFSTIFSHLNSSSSQHLNFDSSTNVASMSAELDLGTLHLTVAKSELEVQSTTTVFFSRLNTLDDTSARLTLDLHTLERSWVQRGRGLQLHVNVLVEGSPLTPAHLQSLNNIICKAKVWSHSPYSSFADIHSCGNNWVSKHRQSPWHRARQNAPATRQL